MIISAVVAVVGLVLPAWKFYSSHKALIDMGVKALAYATDELSKRTVNTVDDKFALFLKSLTAQVEAKGKTVTEAKAKAVFEKLQGSK